MFKKLKNLVFGLEEYEKIRIEDRFEILKIDLSQIHINSLENFECIEDCIYKIHEQLRLKSSNLCKSINNPAKNIRKKDVEEVLLMFNKIKYDFIKQTFSQINLSEMPSEVPDIKTEEVKEINEAKEENNSQILIKENEKYKIYLNNGKTSYILIDFKNSEIDLPLTNKLASLLFEKVNAHGTNILIENNKALIIPRFENDDIIKIPRIEVDLDDIYEKLTKKEDKKIPENEKEEEAEYLQVTKKRQYNSKNDNSLDDLLKDDFKREIMHPHPKDDPSKIDIFKDDKIIIERKDEIKTPEIEIVREEEIVKDDKEEISGNLLENQKYEIYRDQKIVIYFEEKSKILGELKLKPISGNKINELEETDLSYIMMFAKAFSAYLFEVLEAHGTNLIFNYDNDFISIIPRYQEDGVDIIWKPKQETESFLEEIQKKLISVMHNDTKKKENPKEEVIAKIEEEPKEEKIVKNPESKKQKAQYILDYLNKIP
ncbi:MAG: hypothetical protein PF569_05055 [Candidatus Woesearchaeota archaeon]|jgi:hypothetical protein|nr:hypothetical protein [Candidatus Woesearchaeota archaeon]